MAAGLPRLPIALLHNLGVELDSFQYYYGLVFMVFYQKYTPIQVAKRGCNLIFSMLIYFAPMIYPGVK